MASAALTTAVEAATTALTSTAQRMSRPGRPVSVATGIVVSAGLASKTVKVEVGGEEWNKKVRKVSRRDYRPNTLLPCPALSCPFSTGAASH